MNKVTRIGVGVCLLLLTLTVHLLVGCGTNQDELFLKRYVSITNARQSGLRFEAFSPEALETILDAMATEDVQLMGMLSREDEFDEHILHIEKLQPENADLKQAKKYFLSALKDDANLFDDFRLLHEAGINGATREELVTGIKEIDSRGNDIDARYLKAKAYVEKYKDMHPI